MTENEFDDLKTRRALAALDELAEQWAADVSLDNMVSAIAVTDDRESRIAALVKQAFVEGSYRAWLAAKTLQGQDDVSETTP